MTAPIRIPGVGVDCGSVAAADTEEAVSDGSGVGVIVGVAVDSGVGVANGSGVEVGSRNLTIEMGCRLGAGCQCHAVQPGVGVAPPVVAQAAINKISTAAGQAKPIHALFVKALLF